MCGQVDSTSDLQLEVPGSNSRPGHTKGLKHDTYNQIECLVLSTDSIQIMNGFICAIVDNFMSLNIGCSIQLGFASLNRTSKVI